MQAHTEEVTHIAIHKTLIGAATMFRSYIRTWRLDREGEMLIIAELVPSVSYKPKA